MSDWTDRWEMVIGLEVHTHLKTESKLFSPAPVRYGAEPNHAVHPVDLALPGVLPVLNERVVELAIRLGLAIHATVNPHSVFARKNYFYPDLPKGYQISQFEEPIVSGGWLEIEVESAGSGKEAGKKEAGKKGLDIQRYKGLGEMNAEELAITTMDSSSRTLLRVKIEDAMKADEMFSTLSGKDVKRRREYIETHALDVKNLDI